MSTRWSRSWRRTDSWRRCARLPLQCERRSSGDPRSRARARAAIGFRRPCPFLARPESTAVVVPKMAPLHGPAAVRAASAVDESRIGAGRGYFRYTPGNVRYVRDFPADSLIVRRDAFLTLAPDVEIDDVVSYLTPLEARGPLHARFRRRCRAASALCARISARCSPAGQRRGRARSLRSRVSSGCGARPRRAPLRCFAVAAVALLAGRSTARIGSAARDRAAVRGSRRSRRSCRGASPPVLVVGAVQWSAQSPVPMRSYLAGLRGQRAAGVAGPDPQLAGHPQPARRRCRARDP